MQQQGQPKMQAVQLETPPKAAEEIARQRQNLEETIVIAYKHAYAIEEELLSRPQAYGEVVRLHEKAIKAGNAIQYLTNVRWNRYLAKEEQEKAIAKEKAKLNVIKTSDAQKMELTRNEHGFWLNAKGEPVGVIEEEKQAEDSPKEHKLQSLKVHHGENVKGMDLP